MKYPYIFYGNTIKCMPVFKDLKGMPFVADMSSTSELLHGIEVRDQVRFQKILEHAMQGSYHWGVSSYLENREILLSDCPQMVKEQRFFHLGLDVIVPLGTPLHAPLDSEVEASGYEAGEGNYGGYVLLKHPSDLFEPFYSFYGHLCRDKLPVAGEKIAAGGAFAEIGDFHENGNWFYHTHIQVITTRGLERGYMLKGYCSKDDLATIDELCPSPLSLFITS
jgi:hypothetical protein